MKIDWWTLSLQAVNVIVLLWVLQRFFFKPVLAIIAERQQATQKMMSDASAAKERADQERVALEAERAQLTDGRERVLAAVQVEAQKAREAMMAQAREDVKQLMEASHTTLQRERSEAAVAVRREAAALAGDIARRLLERFSHQSLNRWFIEGACHQLSTLAPTELALLSQDDTEAKVNVASADPLRNDDREFLRSSLHAVLGREAPASFAVDSTLIAGIELRFRHMIIKNHWAADLENILQQVNESSAHP
jgi:F-type H+-transporting ATPase subunit b